METDVGGTGFAGELRVGRPVDVEIDPGQAGIGKGLEQGIDALEVGERAEENSGGSRKGRCPTRLKPPAAEGEVGGSSRVRPTLRGILWLEDLQIREITAEIRSIAGDETAAVRSEGSDQHISDGAFRKNSGTPGGDVKVPCQMGGSCICGSPAFAEANASLPQKGFLFIPVSLKGRGQFHKGNGAD